MSKINFLLVLIFTSFNFACSQTLSLEKYSSYFESNNDSELPSDLLYVKDLNNSLDRFVGSWRGTKNDIEVLYQITKTVVSDSEGFLADALKIKYELKNNQTNEILFTTLALPDDDVYVMEGAYYLNKYYVGYYYGLEGCGQDGWVYLYHDMSRLNGERLNLSIRLDGEILFPENCPNGTPPSPIPSDIWVTKS